MYLLYTNCPSFIVLFRNSNYDQYKTNKAKKIGINEIFI